MPPTRIPVINEGLKVVEDRIETEREEPMGRKVESASSEVECKQRLR